MENIIRTTIQAVWLTCLLTACSSNNTTTSSEKMSGPATVVKGLVTKQLTEKKAVQEQTVFPVDSLLQMKVLTTGTFHDEEVPKGADKERWMGLFKGKEGFYLAETTISTPRVFDPVVDEDEMEKTGWLVTTSVRDSALLLMERLPSLGEGNVQAIAFTRPILYPGDSLSFHFEGNHYQLFAIGIKKEKATDVVTVENYKLYLAAWVNGQRKIQLLVAQPAFDDAMIKLLFIGDIDGDKIPDLIIDTSPHYNLQKPTLYLSRPAAKDKIVKPVGVHSFVGC